MVFFARSRRLGQFTWLSIAMLLAVTLPSACLGFSLSSSRQHVFIPNSCAPSLSTARQPKRPSILVCGQLKDHEGENTTRQLTTTRTSEGSPVDTNTNVGKAEAKAMSQPEAAIQSEVLRQVLKEEAPSDGEEAVATTTDKDGRLPGAAQVEAFLLEPLAELLVCVLVVISTSLAAIDTLPGLDPVICTVNQEIGDVIANMFLVEFLLRWYTNVQLGPKYFFQPLVLIDILVVVLPLFLPFLKQEATSGLGNLRLLRILRLQRVIKDMESFANYQTRMGVSLVGRMKPYKLRIARANLNIFTLLSVTASLIYLAEHEVNPDIPDFFTAFYFGLTTLTTVGFGDVTPQTAAGKFVVSASILAGVAIIPAQATELIGALMERENVTAGEGATLIPSMLQRLQTNQVSCQECGAKGHVANAKYCYSCGTRLDQDDDDDLTK